MLQRITSWIDDPSSGPVVPDAVKQAIHSVAKICEEGRIPARYSELAMIAVPRLHEEFRGYCNHEYGKIQHESGAPGPGFWGAVKAVVIAHNALSEPSVERLEPVGVLIEQGVTHEQIARHIYGRRGEGPFIQPNGAPDVGLIEKEAREPGSVITSDWIPPWHKDLLEHRQFELSARLKKFDDLEWNRKYEDPATVEELLQDGAFVQQIERAKGVSRDEVLETAERIGVKAVDGPGYRPGHCEMDSSDLEDDEAAADFAADQAALKSMVIEIFTESEGKKTAVEIASQVRELGHIVSENSVSQMIVSWKRRQSRTAPAAS